MRLWFAAVLTVLTWLAALGPARAVPLPFSYQFADQTGTPTSSFTLTVGQTVPIQVYLVENPSGSVLQTEGLFSAGLQVNFGDTSKKAGAEEPGSSGPSKSSTSRSGSDDEVPKS